MKTPKNCECCSSKSKCIVITIETCCKKNCEEYKKSHGVKIKGDESDSDVKSVSSGPVVMQRSSSGAKNPTKASSSSGGIRKSTSSVGGREREVTSPGEGRGSRESAISGEGRRSREDSTKPTEDDEKEDSVEDIGDTNNLSPSHHDSRSRSRQSVKPIRSSGSRSKQQRIFKLPLLVERHHGPGCAMEISVLEKHDDTCLYKKGDTEGRNEVDDKAGSYDCIGRLVFRTCNSSEAESDTSKLTIHGGSVGPEKNVEVLHSNIKEKSEDKIHQQEEQDSVHSEPTNFDSFEASELDNSKSKSRNESFGSAKESMITSSKQEQLMTAKVATVQNAKPPPKKHYPGDGCKLHPPKTPSFLMNSTVIDQASVSKKVFTVFTEKGNQTELHTKADILDKDSSSQETIASLNDLAKPEEKVRRPSFLGALFRRSSAGKSNKI